MENDIRNLSKEQLEQVLDDLKQPRYRAAQLYEWLHTHNVISYDQMTNLPKSLRAQLSKRFPLDNIQLIETLESADGSRKYLFKLSDGNVVESVGIVAQTQNDMESSTKRLTVCFSTQAGCSMGCEFCATGKQGFSRNLTASEMVEQIIAVQNDLTATTDIKRVNNVVAMGQGEPFLNYDEVMSALKRIHEDKGIGVGARHITISTCGIINGISRFIDEPEQYRLAISLHAADQEKRNKLMPHVSNQTLRRLKEALIDYNLKRNRRVTIEYMMIKGVNDTDTDLEDLISFCKGIHCHVNLIPMNPIAQSQFKPSPAELIKQWEYELSSHGIPTSIRYSKGSDINGACGMLAQTVASEI